ncbi:MAG: hypothetical protein ACQET5_02040 [Halobacteriota archaeon]|uniref:hypothetical protein n=1 Tax=Natronomonas sp. TaxID=2184060 RepID=UPI0039767057
MSEPRPDPTRSVHDYELIRRRHGLSGIVSIPRKIRWCSYLSFVIAASMGALAVLPPSVRKLYLEGEAANQSLGVGLVALFCVGAVVVGAVGLAGVALRRGRAESVSREHAWFLVGLEDVFSGIALITGALGVAAVTTLTVVGFAGTETVERLLAAGIDPYRRLAWAPESGFVALAALGCGVFVFLLAVTTDSSMRWTPG